MLKIKKYSVKFLATNFDFIILKYISNACRYVNNSKILHFYKNIVVNLYTEIFKPGLLYFEYYRTGTVFNHSPLSCLFRTSMRYCPVYILFAFSAHTVLNSSSKCTDKLLSSANKSLFI